MPVVKTKKPVSSRVEYTRPTQIKPVIGIREFYEKRNKVLIQRSVGGLGDILMHRMIFEDFKKLMPNAEIHFACPKQYHSAVSDHPFIDKVLNCEETNYHEYLVHYNTSNACGRFEIAMSPLSTKHRSDIWANHCGVELTNHDMHFRFTDDELKQGKDIIDKHKDRDGKVVLFAPISALHHKNLTDEAMFSVATGLRERGFCPIGIHSHAIYGLLKNDVPVIHGVKLRESLAIVNQVDYVVSVDTSHFHAAGGMNKPTVGIFTFANGQTYSLHYPKTELVQGPCIFKYSGCYSWHSCPKSYLPKLPCCSGITTGGILSAFDRLITKYGPS